MKKMLETLSFSLLVGTSAGAFDLTQADAFFAQRDNNPNAIESARVRYEEVLNHSANREEMMHAMDHIGRLDYYEGELLTPADNHDKRVEIFSRCMTNADKVGPARFGNNIVHVYWKAACLALWGKSASWLSAGLRVGELKGLMQQGLALDRIFEGGGMDRLVATIKIRASWMSGLNDPQGALTHIDAAIAKGPQYYNAYVVKAEILKALGRDNEAVKLLEVSKRELEQKVRKNELPVGLEPECKMFLKAIRQALAG